MNLFNPIYVSMEQTYGSVVIDCGYGKKINLHVSLSMFPFVMFLRLHLALIFLGFSQYQPSFTFATAILWLCKGGDSVSYYKIDSKRRKRF